MPVSIKPIGCHGDCYGCYEEEVRKCNQVKNNYPLMIETLEKLIALDGEKKYNCPGLHGGEPLQIPIEYMDKMFSIIFNAYSGKNKFPSIQTSTIGLTGDHIEIFKKYNVGVGVSLDGDTLETNADRLFYVPANSKQSRMEYIFSNIRSLRDAKLRISIIALGRKCNQYELPRFISRMNNDFGITAFRVNPFLANHGDNSHELTGNEWGNLLIKLTDLWSINREIDLRPIVEMKEMLNGESGGSCLLSGCDIWSTDSDTTILQDGSIGGCQHGASAIDGVMALRADNTNKERTDVLYQIYQDNGGCFGCYWWDYCHGGCPASGINDDWRNKTRWCAGYKVAFNYLSTLPVFVKTNRSKNINTGHGDSHGDRPHGDSNDPQWRKEHPEWNKKKG